jgi:hypothetical protein
LREELRDPQPGGFLVAQQLAYLILVQALRLHLAEGLKGSVGWLFALSDKQMSAAISSMHDQPARDWTVEELGQRAGMSRCVGNVAQTPQAGYIWITSASLRFGRSSYGKTSASPRS